MENVQHLTQIEQAAQDQVPAHQTEPYFEVPSDMAEITVTVTIEGGPADYEESLQSLTRKEGNNSAGNVDQLLVERYHLFTLR